jgi:hypothetical protein
MARAHAGPMPAPTPIRPRERRRGNRQPLGVSGLVTEPNAPDKPLEVSVLNVSLHGCAFRSPVAFRPGGTYSMRIGTGPLHLTSTIRVVSSRDRADGTFDVGAKFV